MLALRTKFLGPSNVRGSRIKCDDGQGRSVTVAYSHERHPHAAAVEAFAEKHLRMRGTFIGGHYGPDEMVWVINGGDDETVTINNDRGR